MPCSVRCWRYRTLLQPHRDCITAQAQDSEGAMVSGIASDALTRTMLSRLYNQGSANLRSSQIMRRETKLRLRFFNYFGLKRGAMLPGFHLGSTK